MIRLILLLTLILSLPQKTMAACSMFHQGYFSWVPSTKIISITQIQPNKKRICGPLKEDSQANLMIEITHKNKLRLMRKIFIQTNIFWDDLQTDGKLSGGATASSEIFFNTLIPENYQGASFKIYDLKKKKILGEMRL